MNIVRKIIVPVFFAGIWISASEFIRNQLVFRQIWIDHYSAKGLVFPETPLNGALWGIWSFMFAGLIFIINRKYTLRQTLPIAWVFGFVLMWVVIGNLGVLPLNLLPFAVPLSMVETLIAVLIIRKLS